jgi:hypothetical protein|uniref:SET domain-containing protein n=1 Tax=viral metagenome TaxID=1070528 RepID=A0A6C0BQJ2_9ZZZZ
MSSLVDCSKVCVNASNVLDDGCGAFANQAIKNGDIVEKGLVRIIEFDGNKNEYVFTWSEDRTKWAFASGCATFYNTSLTPNTKMIRDFDNNTFTIYAIKNIDVGEELTHTYKSLEWRKCFNSLKEKLVCKE